MRFNTGISAMMEFVNGATKWPDRPRAALEPFALLLSPYAPHLAEELWQVRPCVQALRQAWPWSMHGAIDSNEKTSLHTPASAEQSLAGKCMPELRVTGPFQTQAQNLVYLLCD